MVLLGYAMLALFVYVFVVKLRDFGVRPRPPEEAGPAKPSLAALEAAVADSPSFHNRVQLAWALLDQGQPAGAITLFEQALATHRADKHAQLGLGYALLDAGDAERAASVLTAIVERSFGYAEYSAASALLEALERSGQDVRAVELAERMAKDSRRLRHQMVVARQYARVQRRADAIALLRTALHDFEAQPELDRRRDGAAATEARTMLRLLEQHDAAAPGAALPRA